MTREETICEIAGRIAAAVLPVVIPHATNDEIAEKSVDLATKIVDRVCGPDVPRELPGDPRRKGEV